VKSRNGLDPYNLKSAASPRPTKPLSSKISESSKASVLSFEHRRKAFSRPTANGQQHIVHHEDEVGSQSSLMSVHSFWDSLRNITGCDVRPHQSLRHHLAHFPQFVFDYEAVIEQLIDEGVQPGDLDAQLLQRMNDVPPPPVSAKQWVAAAFRIAESSLATGRSIACLGRQ